MLEYRRPGPAPGPQWAQQRAQWIFEQREDADLRPVPLGPARLLARSADALVTLRVGARLAAAIFELSVITVSDELEVAEATSAEAPEAPPATLPDEFFRFGVSYADGRTTTNLPGAYWNAPQHGPVFVALNWSDQEEPPGFLASWTVWPLPPSGPVVVACAWPAAGIAESVLTLDGDAFRPLA